MITIPNANCAIQSEIETRSTFLLFFGGLLFFVWALEAQSADKQLEGRPGTYIVWASADDSVCRSVAQTVNALPGQLVSDAAARGTSGFLKWTSEPQILMKSTIELTPQPYPRSYLQTDVDGSGYKVYLLRFSWFVNSVLTDRLYITERLPNTVEELDELGRSRVPAFGEREIVRTQKLYGADWEKWYLSGQFLVTVMDEQPRPYFLAESSYQSGDGASQILVFTLDRVGTRSDICMLRRLCNCGDQYCGHSLQIKDRSKLTPSSDMCKK